MYRSLGLHSCFIAVGPDSEPGLHQSISWIPAGECGQSTRPQSVRTAGFVLPAIGLRSNKTVTWHPIPDVLHQAHTLNCDRASRESEKMRVRFPSRNIEAASCPSFSIFDGSQNWFIAHNDVVAGSSPASGSKCRGSSVVEHVNSQFVSYPSVLSAGRRLWVIGTVGWRFKSALPLRRK